MFKIVDLDILPKDLLGKYLDDEAVRLLDENEVDVCGENGEYHTVVVDGPIFKHPLNIKPGEVGESGHFAYIGTDL